MKINKIMLKRLPRFAALEKRNFLRVATAPRKPYIVPLIENFALK